MFMNQLTVDCIKLIVVSQLIGLASIFWFLYSTIRKKINVMDMRLERIEIHLSELSRLISLTKAMMYRNEGCAMKHKMMNDIKEGTGGK